MLRTLTYTAGLLTFGILSTVAMANSPIDEEDFIKSDSNTVLELEGLINGLDEDAASLEGEIDALSGDADTMFDADDFNLGGVWSSIDEGKAIFENSLKDDLERPGVLYVMVSLSMPDNMLKEYLHDSHKAGATVIVRGFVDDPDKPNKVSAAKTISRFHSLVKDGNMGGVVLNPRAFTAFGIDAVPAFVSATKPAPAGETTDQTEYVPHDKLSGAVSLKFALEKLASDGSEAQSVAQNRLDAYLRDDTFDVGN